MKGILLLSHGELAKGMADSARLFFGDTIDKLDYLCLYEGANADEYEENIAKKLSELDSGDGVVILADLYGGTPSNRAVKFLGDGIDLIPGMNMCVLAQLLSDREFGQIDLSTAIEEGRKGILNVKDELFSAIDTKGNNDDEWF